MEELKTHKDERGRTWYTDKESGKEYYYRVRKLTPGECFRLMGVKDPEIKILLGCGVSNSQLYKLAGNSIVVDQLVYLFKQMFSPERITGHKQPKQLKLF